MGDYFHPQTPLHFTELCVRALKHACVYGVVSARTCDKSECECCPRHLCFVCVCVSVIFISQCDCVRACVRDFVLVYTPL